MGITNNHFCLYLEVIDLGKSRNVALWGFQNFTIFIMFLKIFLLFIFREGREGERKGEKHRCVVASHVPPIGDMAHNPGMCPDWESNQQPFGSQAGTQSTEPHQPGLNFTLLYVNEGDTVRLLSRGNW